MGQAPKELTPERSAHDRFGAALRQWRELRGLSQAALARQLFVSPSYVAKVETARRVWPVELTELCDRILDAEGELRGLDEQMRMTLGEAAATVPGGSPGEVVPSEGDLQFPAFDDLRRLIDERVGSSSIGASGLDRWQEIVELHAAATRHRPPFVLARELADDLLELRRLLSLPQRATMVTEITRLTAQMAGMMSLTLLKVNDQHGSRVWARTALHAADESGDRRIGGWVRAQQAHTAYYAGDLAGAIRLARGARAIAGAAACVGSALAAALEARALGMQGLRPATQTALRDAEAILEALSTEETARSALGYDEAQLRFHQGNAYTHLGDSARAWNAQRRALELYPVEDYLDRSLIYLDRAACLVRGGEIEAAVEIAVAAITGLRLEQRRGMVTSRAHEILNQLNDGRPVPGAVQNLRELLRDS
jgi:transcriptional regulator with XRE-family HTH domain